MNLSQLLYISDAREAISNAQLETLTAHSRQKNGERDISGILLCSGGHFLQLLEGDQSVIETLFAKIRQDVRHENVEQLHLEKCGHRLFPNWRMGLINLDTLGPLDRGRLQKMITGLKKAPNGMKILSLLREFRDQLPASDEASSQAA